jgi:hypothetical protein
VTRVSQNVAYLRGSCLKLHIGCQKGNKKRTSPLNAHCLKCTQRSLTIEVQRGKITRCVFHVQTHYVRGHCAVEAHNLAEGMCSLSQEYCEQVRGRVFFRRAHFAADLFPQHTLSSLCDCSRRSLARPALIFHRAASSALCVVCFII